MHYQRVGCTILAAMASVLLTANCSALYAQDGGDEADIAAEEVKVDAAQAGELGRAKEGEPEPVEAAAPVEAEPATAEPAAEQPVAVEVPAEEAAPADTGAVAAEPEAEAGGDKTVQDLAAEAVPAAEPVEAAAPVEAEPVAEPAAEQPAAAQVPAPEAAPAAEAGGAAGEAEPVVEAPAQAEPVAEPAAEQPAAAQVPAPEAAPAAEAPAPAAEAPDIEDAAEAATQEALKAAGEKTPPEVEALLRKGVPAKAGEDAAGQAAAAPRRTLDPKVSAGIVMKEAEIMRREAEERHARELLQKAEQAMAQRKFQEAAGLFDDAVKIFSKLPERAETLLERQRAKRGIAEAYYRLALVLLERQDFKGAQDAATQAIQSSHPKGHILMKRIKDEEEAASKKPPEPTPGHVVGSKENREKQNKIAIWLREGTQHYQIDDLDKAQEKFELVMKEDPYNVEAIRMLHKVYQRRLDLASEERESTRKDMMAEVVKAWNPRDYAIGEAGVPIQERPTVAPPVNKERQRILDKMSKIRIPEIDFRQANINDVIQFLQNASVEFDETSDETKGVNIILNLQAAGGGAPAGAGGGAGQPASEEVFGAEESSAAPAGGGIPLVTFSARYISLLEALNIVTKVAGLKYRIEGSVVMIVPLNAPEGELIQRMYDVLPTFMTRAGEVASARAEGGGQARTGGVGDFTALESVDMGTADRSSDQVKAMFEEMGVKWPLGSKVRYVPTIGKLVVVNTAENLAILEGILPVLNLVPNQIEIEARFVEVRESDLESLGFEWLLNGDWNIAQKKGQEKLPLNQRELIRMNANAASGGFTTGNRYVGNDTLIPRTYLSMRDSLVGQVTTVPILSDSLFTVAGILTDPQLSMVLHALQQRGNADVLSAPKVTTQSGAEATIKVVTEYIYPTEYTVTPVTATDANGNTTIIGGIVEPGGFETREVGVILQVVPEVTPDGQMINLTMTPQVVSDPVWHDYGSTYVIGNNTQRLKMEMPFFHTRMVTTSISIFNGATVVMGGMITEDRRDVDDKIPFLGDIPIVGRLFRSRVEQSQKNNLLIFVTARQVDPAGRALKRVGSTTASPAP